MGESAAVISSVEGWSRSCATARAVSTLELTYAGT